MYSYIIGTIKEIGKSYAIIDNNGIGYFINASSYTLADLEVNEEYKIFTFFSASENGVNLYGFSEKSEHEMFELLTKVNSIGPKNALSILSTLPVNVIKYSILNNDIKTLSKAPGVGKKTASKIVIELLDRIKKEDIEQDIGDLKAIGNKKNEENENYDIALEALQNLGYTRHEVEKALASMDLSSMTLQEVIKKALATFSI